MAGLKLPLHEVCLDSNKLCGSCRLKIEKGQVEHWEVRVLKALLEAYRSTGSESSLAYEASTIAGSTLYIALEGPPLEGLEEALSRALRLRGVARVRIIYFTGGLKGLLEKILDQKVIAVNKFYSVDGALTLKVTVENRNPGAEKLASSLLKIKVITEESKTERETRGKPLKVKVEDVKKTLDKLF
ncbi:MAG: hypothetical protein P3X22_000405 [Thermoprotei archaeon]|nr:hypothetical protein [Thermoprotei archaeon]